MWAALETFYRNDMLGVCAGYIKKETREREFAAPRQLAANKVTISREQCRHVPLDARSPSKKLPDRLTRSPAHPLTLRTDTRDKL